MTAKDLLPALPSHLHIDLERLRQLNTLDIQSNWQIKEEDSNLFNPAEINSQKGWPVAKLNDRQHIAWPKGLNIIWLYQSITIPHDLNGYPLTGLILRVALTWWAEDAQIYIDGILAQSGDLFECFTRLCLCQQAVPGRTFKIAIRLVSPGHDDGALVRSQLIYELPSTQPTPEPSFIADELTVLATLEPDASTEITTALSQLSWETLVATKPSEDTSTESDINSALGLWDQLSTNSPIPATVHPFQQSLSQLRRTLKPLSSAIKRHNIKCIGHAHLDMAWLWPIADTWEAAERTFRSILNLQTDFPKLTYTHSSPALFEWLEHNRPDLFSQIQTKVKEGSWSIDAGLWIEPEFNIISGESIARQILYGQRYCQEKFGRISKVAWLPDSFGFCWQLPQLLTQGGITTFATLKLSWNDTTTFPHSLFWWESPDGSRIRSIMLPPIGTDIDPLKMATYASNWETNTQILDTLWLPGLGDHGGGPTRDMLEKSRRWQKSPFFPNLSFTTAEKYINELPLTHDSLEKDSSENDSSAVENHSPPRALPIWNDELYLELHRGCYTTHADQKQANRRCEDLLYQAEVFATVAQIMADQPYPKTELDTAWKKLLFNQFHDILPGTSIPEVFVDADKAWGQVKSIGSSVLNESIDAIANHIPLPKPPHPQAKPILIFNPLSWPRTSIISIALPAASSDTPASWKICDTQNYSIPYQIHTSTKPTNHEQNISFLAQDLPAIGYQYFWLCPHDSSPTHPTPDNYTLENDFLKVCIDSNTGQITSLIEKRTHTETFQTPGNQLQTYQDKGQYWDAWNIDPNYQHKALPTPTLQSIQWIESGPIYQKIRTLHTFQASTNQESAIEQTYTLEAGTPFLKITTHINWQEPQVLLKAHFPFTITATEATYETPFGAITRNTQPQTDAEKAKWEVPALRWADLTETNTSSTFGISILTDCKHGFDSGPNHLRLTLLKSPIWPDPNSDKGEHKFTYAIYPHANTWQKANTVQYARELNIPPVIHHPTKHHAQSEHANDSGSFLQIHNQNVILSALKPAEDNPNEIVLRCYESQGANANLKIHDTLGLLKADAYRTDLLEQSVPKDQLDLPVKAISPWQVVTYRLKQSSKKGPTNE